MILKIYRIDETVPLPTFATSYSTCFDIRYAPRDSEHINGYSKVNLEVKAFLRENKTFDIYPGDRMLVPTGLIFALSADDGKANSTWLYPSYSIRLHSRSGLALKNGLVLANGEGVIDADYQKEVFVLLTNISDVTQSIHLNDRIAQAEVVQNFSSIVKMYETPTPPVSLSERNGGFGSTGTT
jgi:dUTP pyrophosphatase